MSTQEPARRPRVALVFGGRSSEHAISCITAAGVMRAIDPEAYDVLPIGISRSGRWVVASGDPAHWEVEDGTLPEVSGTGTAVTVPLSTDAHEVVAVPGDSAPGRILGGVDVVFPLLHGPFGEDGTLQGMLELADIPYVGDGVFASAACMDKHFMKVVLASAGLPVGPYVTFRDRDWDADPGAVTDRVAALGWPVYVKPARAGSSVGITRVTDPAGLPDAVATARANDPKIVVEAEIVGREIECGVLGDLDGGVSASVPGEVVAAGDHQFYDFEAKYLDESGSRLSCPADLPAATTARVRDLAVRAFRAFDGEGLARVDFFVTPDDRVIVNELNTMPGFTPISMYPKMWEATGLGYRELIDRLIQLALHRPTGLR